MNIWIVNQYACPFERHHNLATNLSKQGHKVTIVASSFDHKTRKETLSSEKDHRYEIVDNVGYLWLRTPPYHGNSVARIRNMLAFGNIVRRKTGRYLAEKPDVLMGSSPHLFAAVAARDVANRYNAAFVLEVRDLWPESYIQLAGLSRNNPLIRYLAHIEKGLYRDAAQIVTLLPNSVDYIVERGAKRENITWIPNGVNMDLIPPVCVVPPNRPFTVIYAGAHGFANGLDVIIDAAKILEDRGREVLFRFIGDGPEKARLEARVREEGIGSVRFEEAVPKKEIFARLQEADAFVVALRDSPLYKYGISLNKIYDYLVMGRPIVFAANSSNNPVSEAGAGLVTSISPDAMAEAIENLMSMPESERWAMGQKGREYIERNNDFRKLSISLERVLTKALRQNPGQWPEIQTS